MRIANDSFRITIYYREPTYELVAGRKKHPYSWTWEVVAQDESAARAQAMRQFEDLARRSSVGWVRRIEGVLTEVPGGLRMSA